MIYLIALILLLLISGLAYSIYKSNWSDVVKMTVLPLAIAFSGLVGYHYLDSLGKPLNKVPEGKWEYIWHEAYGNEIQLWAIVDGESRLYVVPYSEEIRKELEKAQEREGRGEAVEGEFAEQESETNSPEYDITISTATDNTTKQ